MPNTELKKIEFWEVDAEEATYIYDVSFANAKARQAGLVAVSDGDIKDIYGDKAKKRVVHLKPNDYTLRLAINKLLQKPDEKQGSKLNVDDLDADQLAAIRAEAVIAKWNFGVEPTSDNYLALNNVTRDYLSDRIFQYIAPDIARNPDFFAIWNAKQTQPAA